MTFEDSVVKMLCVNNFDTDGNGWLSYDDVANVTSITNVFNGNTEIEYFPELNSFTSVTKLGDNSFGNCSNLKEVGLDNITIIDRTNGSGALFNSGVEMAIMPNIVNVGNYSFRQCRSLHSVYAGANCNNIGFWAFRDCSNLQRLVCMATTPPTIDDAAFIYSTFHYGNGDIYVPNASVDAYKSAWGKFADMIKGISELPTDTEFYNKISKYLKYKRI